MKASTLAFAGLAVFMAHGSTVATPVVDLGEYKVTAYCSCKICCGPKSTGVFANGEKVYPIHAWVVVAAGKQFRFGTRLFVGGIAPVYREVYGEQPNRLIGPVVVKDRGLAIRGKRLDLYVESHEIAVRFGVRKLHIFAIEAGK